MTYEQTRAYAQTLSDEDGFDRGIWRDAFGQWVVQILPRRENRRGHELTCETVHCTDLTRCRGGHGPPQ